MDGRSGGGGGGNNRAGWQGGNYDATNQIKQLLGIVENDVGKEVPRTPPRNTQGDLGGGPRTPSRNNRGDVGKQAKTPPRNMHNDTRSSPRNSQPQNIPYNSHRQHLNDNRSGSPYRHQRDSNRYDGRHHYGSPSHHHGQSRYGHYNHYGSPRNHRDYNINGPRHGTPPTESSINSEESPDYKPSSEDLSKLEEQFLFPLKKRSIRFPKARYFCRLCDYHCDSMAVCRRHMADNRHQKLKDARDAETTLKNVPCPTPAHIVAIDALVKSIAEEYQVTPEMRQQRFDVVEELSNLLDAKAIGCRLDLVGSTLSCFALKTSDVNVDIVMESGLNISTALLAVKELVTKNDNYSDVLDDLCSAFPTMSVTHVTTGLRLVVGAGSVCSKMTNQLLGDYSSLDERVPILGVVFRRWAQLCHIDEQPKGTLPAHTFPIMVVHFLQQHRVPILPVLHQFVQNPDGETYLRPSEFDKKWTSSNCLSVGELWLDMFRFYAIGFKMADLVINIRQHQPMSRAEKTWNKKIAIEDPFQQKRTLSRTVSGNPVFEYITDRFKVTYKYFAIPQMKMGPIFNHIVVKETCHSASEGSSEYETDKAEDEMDDDDSEEEKDSPGPILHNLISHLKIQENEAEQDTSNNIADHEDDNLIPILEDLRSTLSLVTPSVAQKLYKQVTSDHLKFRFDANCFTGGSLPPLICGSCQKEGHCKAECQEDDLPPLIELPPTSKAFIQQLTSIFEQLTRDFEPTKDEIDDRDMIVADLEKYITSANGFSGARLQLFGSSANGFGFQRSDLDICLTFDGDATGQDVNHIKIIEKLAERLKRYRQCQHVFAITTAKVPIVKFSIRRRDHLEGDLSLYNTLALQNTKLLATYAKIDHRVKCLGYAMKYFAKLCDIGDASRGSLSSYAYILMVLHFLQHTTPPVIPVLQELYDQSKTAPKLIIDGWNAWFFDNVNNLSSVWPDHGKNKETLGELWIGMLKYYTETFNWKENVVTIKQFAPLTRLEKLWNSRCIVIEDPFDLNHNLGAGLSRKMNTFIMKAFIRGREIFGTPMTNLPPGCRNLVDYLFDNKNLTDGAPPNDRGCRYCGKIGHIQRDCPKKKINQEKKEKREKQKDRKERRQYEEDRLEDERHKQKEDMKLNERVGVSTSTSPSNNREGISYSLAVPRHTLKSHAACWENDKQYVEQGRINLGMNRHKCQEYRKRYFDPGTVMLTSDNDYEDDEYIWTFSAQVVYASIFMGILNDYDYPYWNMYYFILKSVNDNVIPELECFEDEINQNDLLGKALKSKMKEANTIRRGKKRDKYKKKAKEAKEAQEIRNEMNECIAGNTANIGFQGNADFQRPLHKKKRKESGYTKAVDDGQMYQNSNQYKGNSNGAKNKLKYDSYSNDSHQENVSNWSERRGQSQGKNKNPTKNRRKTGSEPSDVNVDAIQNHSSSNDNGKEIFCVNSHKKNPSNSSNSKESTKVARKEKNSQYRLMKTDESVTKTNVEKKGGHLLTLNELGTGERRLQDSHNSESKPKKSRKPRVRKPKLSNGDEDSSHSFQ